MLGMKTITYKVIEHRLTKNEFSCVSIFLALRPPSKCLFPSYAYEIDHPSGNKANDSPTVEVLGNTGVKLAAPMSFRKPTICIFQCPLIISIAVCETPRLLIRLIILLFRLIACLMTTHKDIFT